MRRWNTYILLFVLTIPLCAQQRLQHEELYLGVQGGISLSMVHFEPAVSTVENFTNGHLGWNIGAVFRYAGHNHCGLQVELNYMQRGWHESIPSTPLEHKADYYRTLHYFEIPFLTHIFFGSPHFRGFINLGPQIGYCFKEHERGDRQTDVVAQYEPIDKPFDWGVCGGVGLYYRHQKAGIIQVEARFNYSFGDIYPTRGTNYFNVASCMDFTINLGYLIPLTTSTK